jgi:hypothetical protein
MNRYELEKENGKNKDFRAYFPLVIAIIVLLSIDAGFYINWFRDSNWFGY